MPIACIFYQYLTPIFVSDCWGHRGVSITHNRDHLFVADIILKASAWFPENTLASFEAAIRDGAEGIESGNFLVLAHTPLWCNHTGRRALF
jgi:hypothetical protein